MKQYYPKRYPFHWLLAGIVPNPNIGKYAPNRKPKRKGRKK